MKKTLAVVALGVSVSAGALADAGIYVAFDAGRSTFRDACNAIPATVSCEDTDTMLRIAAGYNFAQLWGMFTPGIEVGYADLGQAKFSGGGFKATALQVEAAGSLAVSDALSFIAKLGVVEAYSDLDAGVQGFGTPGASSTRTNGACAIGAQYDFNKQFGVRAQYENLRMFGSSIVAGETNVTAISVGLVYRL